jgi:thiol-disulfide isomerase/thioredoxin
MRMSTTRVLSWRRGASLVRHMPGWLLIMISLASFASATAMAADAPSQLSGVWSATVGVGAIQVPFKFGIAQHGNSVSGWFFNGDQRVVSDSGSIEGDHLLLEFPSYGRRVDAHLNGDGTLSGSYGPPVAGSTLKSYAFAARPPTREHAERALKESGRAPPSIAGVWVVPAESHKANEKAWRFIARQTGAQVSAAILRVDGDTGALTGSWQDGKFVLSHFDGARPLLIEVTPAPDHTLQLLLRDSSGQDVPLTAYRIADAHSKGVPDAADPASHTSVRDPAEPFQFSFPDLKGHIVSNSDPRFHGKVLVIDVAGSWCPNCHDEAPFLQSLYRKYHGRGLEIVTLSFEEPEQFANPVRLRAFVQDFGLDYTVLLAGTLDDLHAKLPQAVDLDAYPTTFFVGRDGRVDSVHAGFAAAAAGEFNGQLKQNFIATIERLLAQKPPAARVASAP